MQYNTLRNQVIIEGVIVAENESEYGIRITIATNRMSKNHNKVSDYVLVWFENEMENIFRNSGFMIFDRIRIIGEVYSKRIVSKKFNATSYTQFIVAKNFLNPETHNDKNKFVLSGTLERLTETEKGYVMAVNLSDKEKNVTNYPQVYTFGWKPKNMNIGDTVIISGKIQSYIKKIDGKKIYAQKFIATKIVKA